MTSVIVRESIFYAKENNSAVYVCFLDGKQAFDRVWHCGLFYKLCEKVDDTSLSAFMEMYSNMTSVVRNRGHSSAPIPILQGTRQGGRTSAQCYLAYINELINISNSGLGICLYNCNTSCPTVADDMILMAYSGNALQRIFDICYKYSCKWR